MALFGAQDRLASLLQERQAARRKERQSIANMYAQAAATPQQAGLNRIGALFGAGLGQGIAEGLFGESDALAQARQQAEQEQAMLGRMSEIDRNDPAALTALASDLQAAGATSEANAYYKLSADAAERKRKQAVKTGMTQWLKVNNAPQDTIDAYNAGELTYKDVRDELIKQSEGNAKMAAPPKQEEVDQALTTLRGAVSADNLKLDPDSERMIALDMAATSRRLRAENPNLGVVDSYLQSYRNLRSSGRVDQSEGFAIWKGTVKSATGLDSAPSTGATAQTQPMEFTTTTGKKVKVTRADGGTSRSQPAAQPELTQQQPAPVAQAMPLEAQPVAPQGTDIVDYAQQLRNLGVDPALAAPPQREVMRSPYANTDVTGTIAREMPVTLSVLSAVGDQFKDSASAYAYLASKPFKALQKSHEGIMKRRANVKAETKAKLDNKLISDFKAGKITPESAKLISASADNLNVSVRDIEIADAFLRLYEQRLNSNAGL